jgi:hypothetical protein
VSRPSSEPKLSTGPASSTGTVRRLLVAPIRLLARNPGILFVALVAAGFDLLASNGHLLTEVTRRGWLFTGAPALMIDTLRTPWVPVLAAGGFLLRALVTTGLSHQLMLIVRQGRVPLRESLRNLRLGSVFWLAGSELCVYASAALLFGLAYLPAYLIWRFDGTDGTLVLVVLAVAGLPALYVALGGVLFAAVLPLPARRKTAVLVACLRPAVFGPLWLYGAGRTVVDVLLTVALPVLLLRTLHSRVLASVVLAGGLIVPDVVLRGTGYLLTLERLRSDPGVADVFADYLARTPAEN